MGCRLLCFDRGVFAESQSGGARPFCRLCRKRDTVPGVDSLIAECSSQLPLQRLRLAPRASFSQTFPAAGLFTYHCAIHPQMTGAVTITRAPDLGGGPPVHQVPRTGTGTPTPTAPVSIALALGAATALGTGAVLRRRRTR